MATDTQASTFSDKTMLVKVSSAENNNKFYEVILEADGTIAKRWGRVGTTGQSGREAGGRTQFERIINAKQKKGYKPVEVVNDSPVAANKENVRKVSRVSLAADANDKQVLNLIDRLVEKNKHEIMAASGGMIGINADGVIETPLGIIGPDSLKQARKLLKDLKGYDTKSSVYRSTLEEYLTLVPQKLPRQRGWEQEFFTHNPIAKQKSLLEQLEQSYEWYESERAASVDTTDYSNHFRYSLTTLDNKAEFLRVRDMFEKGKSDMHSRSIRNLKLHKLYVLDDRQGAETFQATAKKLGNVQELWHGTQVFNVLSILRKGLFCPDVNDKSIPITGRMFGPGIYGAASHIAGSSSKAAQYAQGYGHRANGNQDMFMLFMDVACGKEYHPNHYTDHAKAYAKHDSIYVHPNTAGVKNNEVIVWNTDQIGLKYLCEFK